jgi:glycosyltransferase involved in cell wall biosynthesis
MSLPASAFLLSVVVPALEPDCELRRCVDSIRLACGKRSGQCEIVVVLPPTRLDEARALLPTERVIAETRPSIYAAMNDGIASSRGRFLYFVGKDDIVLPLLSEAMGALETQNPSALFCDVYWGERGVYRGRPSRWRLLGRNLCHQGIIYSRRAVERHGPYVRRMRVQADHLLNLRLLWDSELRSRVHYLAKPLALYSGAGFSNLARDPVFWRLYPAVMRRHVGPWAACLLTLYRKLRMR